MRRTSHWADDAHGDEQLEDLTPQRRERIRRANHEAIRDSAAMLVLAYPGGVETLVELGVAVASGVPVVWVDLGARLPLSATCPEVCTVVASVEAGLVALARIASEAA